MVSIIYTGSWLHGEAVAAGMVMAADLSSRQGWIEAGLYARIVALLEQAKLPIQPPAVRAAVCVNQRQSCVDQQ